MAITTFAAIDIGSYEISMKIFEFSKKIGFRQLNDVRYRLEIGKGAYSSGRLEPEIVDAICGILKDFDKMMKEFGVSDYRSGTDLPPYRDPCRDPQQCRAAFPGLQIDRGKRIQLQKDDPEGNCDPGCRRRRAAGVSF